MDFLNKKIGIWGFGIVGKAALPYLAQVKADITVMDKRTLSDVERQLLTQLNASFVPQEQASNFLEKNDFILPSPGIDLRPYEHYSHKWISELDIFYSMWKKPIIAITGTVGKTTTTSLLAHLLQTAGKKIALGGNIGTGVLDLLQHVDADYAVVEVSSFQLELCNYFSPTIALWTNLYPNHLDRHETVEKYQKAKEHILAHQASGDYAILPFDLKEKLSNVPAQKIWFTDADLTTTSTSNEPLYCVIDTTVYRKKGTILTEIISLQDYTELTFISNLVAIIATLETLHIPLEKVISGFKSYTTLEHRLEKIAVIDGIEFYNDSKGTLAQATLAAIQKLQGPPIHLICGGLSKGVDRTWLFDAIKDQISSVICFGKEADALSNAAKAQNLITHTCATIEESLQHALENAKAGHRILFSPGGSSYDLFANFEERGNYFKNLVKQLEK